MHRELNCGWPCLPCLYNHSFLVGEGGNVLVILLSVWAVTLSHVPIGPSALSGIRLVPCSVSTPMSDLRRYLTLHEFNTKAIPESTTGFYLCLRTVLKELILAVPSHSAWLWHILLTQIPYGKTIRHILQTLELVARCKTTRISLNGHLDHVRRSKPTYILGEE